MAGRGPVPKPPGKRVDKSHERAVVDLPEAKVKAPAMPRGLRPQAQRWWRTWRASPQAEMFSATDWERLLMLAPLVNDLWNPASSTTLKLSVVQEIRRQEAELGALVGDRLRLRVRLSSEKGAEERAAKKAAASSSGQGKGRRRPDFRLRAVE